VGESLGHMTVLKLNDSQSMGEQKMGKTAGSNENDAVSRIFYVVVF